jgi:hypothetical protein
LIGTALGSCLDVQAECRVCQTINDIDSLFVNCDLFDDGSPNASCESGAGPTPTTTPTPSNTATPTETPTIDPSQEFLGALPRTSGRFNFMSTIGITGADAECNFRFPGTHACTFAELLNAETQGELVGATDVNGMTVTSFWAIDSTRPDVDQCTVSVPWDYSTAHTGQSADVSTLNNATGDLSPIAEDQNCGSLRWVGCCQ